MFYASKPLALAGIALAIALPGFAQEAPITTSAMTCSSYLKLDGRAKAKAVVGTREGAITGATTDLATDESNATNDGDGAGAPGVATAEGTVAKSTDEPATDASTATNDGDGAGAPKVRSQPETTTTAESDALSTEEMVAMADAECQNQPDLSLTDVLSSMH